MNSVDPIKEFKVDSLTVRIYSDRKMMGKAVAQDVAQKMNEIITRNAKLRMIFAAAPSQNEFLAALLKFNIEWSKVEAFHMDEYIGIDEKAPQGFGNFLIRSIFEHKTFRKVNYINSKAINPDDECVRYGSLISSSPIDICAMGIGENGHIAFNDPPVADFNDPHIMKTVELDKVCRQQQVNDGCFATINDVPTHAYTLTIPTLIASKFLFVTVPGPTKAKAVYETLNSPISTDCPSTILRKNSNAILYLDKDSAALLK